MSNTTTHLLSKEEIISKLESLHFSFEEHHWESFQQSNSAVKIPQSTNSPKISAKLIAIPTFVVLAGFIIYFSINKLQSQNTKADTKEMQLGTTAEENKVQEKTEPETKSVTTTPINNKQVATAPVNNTPASVNNTASAVAGSTPVKKELHTDAGNFSATSKTTAINPTQHTPTTASLTPTINNNTRAVNQEVKPIFKRRYEKKTTPVPVSLVPSPEEDDVVIPEN